LQRFVVIVVIIITIIFSSSSSNNNNNICSFCQKKIVEVVGNATKALQHLSTPA